MRKAIVTLSAAVLAACAGGARNEAAIAVYDFGLAAPSAVAEAGWPAMAVEVAAPPWLDALPVDYRLSYDDPLKRREYAASRWAGAPAMLLAQRLRQQLGAASATGHAAVGCLLRVELQEFAQVFDAPERSRSVVQGHVSLVDGERRTVAGRPFAVAQPAATPDAQGGVRALVAASEDLGREIAVWLEGLDQEKLPKGCGLTR